MTTIAELLEKKRKTDEQGAWVPACAGSEKPFYTRTRRKLLYCWQPSTGKHAYLDCMTDIILTDDEAATALGVM
jgi:hypothetical protein